MSKEIKEFEKAFNNGIYVQYPSKDIHKYKLRELFEESLKLNRKLTDSEANKFLIKA